MFFNKICLEGGNMFYPVSVLGEIGGGQSTKEIMSGSSIGWVDILVTAVYLIGVVVLGCWAGLRHKKKGGEASDYFLAGKTLKWPVIGMALFATNISCVHLVSLAQSGFDTGLLNGN
jgi:hypothetical protein